MVSTEASLEHNRQAGTWIREFDSVTSRLTWMGPNRALSVGPSGCNFFKMDCNGDYRGGRVGAYG